MISFLEQGLLWLLIAAIIPVLIHLMNRRRHRTVAWAAMSFLLKATRESRGQKRLKHILILTFRTLAILAIALVAARPLLGGFFGWNGGTLDTVILVLDRSASMELSPEGDTDSKRASVVERIKNSLSEIGNPRLVLIDSASKQPQDISSPDILHDLSSTQATDTSSNIPELIIQAVDFITNQKLGRSEIWLASDLQAADWKHDEGKWASARAALETLDQRNSLRVLALTGKPKPNFSIQITSSRRVEEELILEIELQKNIRTAPSEIIVNFNINGTSTATPLTIQGQTLVIQKRFEIAEDTDSGFGYASITPDANPRDNVSYFAFGETKSSYATVVSEDDESRAALEHAAALPGLESQELISISPSEWDHTSLNQSALVLWQAPLPTANRAEKLLDFLKQGGVVIFFPPTTEDTGSFQGVSWTSFQNSAENMFFVVPNWNKTDGPLRNGLENLPLPVQKLKAIRRSHIQGDSSQLATWDDETPFLSRKFIDRGTMFFVSSLPNYSWSNLELGDILVPLVQRSLIKGTQRFGSGLSAEIGTDGAEPLLGETRVRIDEYSQHLSSNENFTAGVWKFGDRFIATNRPYQEDTPEIISSDTLDNFLNNTNYMLFEDKGSQTNDSFTQEIWQAILIAMLLFLIIEALLCLQPKRNPALD